MITNFNEQRTFILNDKLSAAAAAPSRHYPLFLQFEITSNKFESSKVITAQ
jgi:hypothetical protein